MADLREQGIVTQRRTLKTGERIGGIPFTRGPLAYLLRNRFYIGEIAFKGEVLKGEQPAILDRALFDAVQAKLSEQANNHKTIRMKSQALLAGWMFDDRGNRMSPTHARFRHRRTGRAPGRRRASAESRLPRKSLMPTLFRASFFRAGSARPPARGLSWSETHQGESLVQIGVLQVSKSKWRALRELEHAGLIEAEERPRKSPIITVRAE